MNKNELVGLIIFTAIVIFVIFGIPYALDQRNIQSWLRTVGAAHAG